MASAEVVEFLGLIERVVGRQGYLFTAGASDHEAFRLEVVKAHFSSSQTHLPVEVNACGDADLREHDSDNSNLQALLVAKALDRDLVQSAHKLLNAQFLHIDSEHRPSDHQTLPLHTKLIALKKTQARAQGPEPKTFALTAICGVCPLSGLPNGSQTYHLSTEISWLGLQTALTDMTKSWQAREAGFASGYSLAHGKWQYQLEADISSKALHNLSNEADCKTLRRRMIKEDSSKVLVWHERLWDASQQVRAEKQHEMGRMVDRVSHGGWELWDPFVNGDAFDGVELDWGAKFSVSEAQALEVGKGKRKANDDDQRTPKRSRPQLRSSKKSASK